MEFQEKEVIFKDNGGHEREMVAPEVFLIIKGKMNTQAETEMTKTKMKLNWGATLLAGGIPILRSVKEKISDRSGQTEYFARLYVKESSEPSVEMLHLHMNYSFLAAKIALSSATNFNTVLNEISRGIPSGDFRRQIREDS